MYVVKGGKAFEVYKYGPLLADACRFIGVRFPNRYSNKETKVSILKEQIPL